MARIELWRIPTFVKAAVVVVVVAGVVTAVVLQLKSKPVNSAGVTVLTPTPVSTLSGPLKVVVISGGQTGCTSQGGCGPTNYTKLLAFREGWTVTSLQAPSTGYVAGSTTKPNNYGSRLAAAVKLKPDLVIVEGSTSDATHPPALVQAAAIKLLTELRAALPAAKLVTVGPIWGGTPTPQIAATENAVKEASVGRVNLFIDPIAEGWFEGTKVDSMGTDHKHPTEAGHLTIAASITFDLGQARIVAT